MEALDKANAVRTWRRERKEEITERGIEYGIELLLWAEPHNHETRTWKLMDFLSAFPGYGKARDGRVFKVLREARLTPSHHLGALTMRQRIVLAEAIRNQRPPSRS